MAAKGVRQLIDRKRLWHLSPGPAEEAHRAVTSCNYKIFELEVASLAPDKLDNHKARREREAACEELREAELDSMCRPSFAPPSPREREDEEARKRAAAAAAEKPLKADLMALRKEVDALESFESRYEAWNAVEGLAEVAVDEIGLTKLSMYRDVEEAAYSKMGESWLAAEVERDFALYKQREAAKRREVEASRERRKAEDRLASRTKAAALEYQLMLQREAEKARGNMDAERAERYHMVLEELKRCHRTEAKLRAQVVSEYESELGKLAEGEEKERLQQQLAERDRRLKAVTEEVEQYRQEKEFLVFDSNLFEETEREREAVEREMVRLWSRYNRLVEKQQSDQERRRIRAKEKQEQAMEEMRGRPHKIFEQQDVMSISRNYDELCRLKTTSREEEGRNPSEVEADLEALAKEYERVTEQGRQLKGKYSAMHDKRCEFMSKQREKPPPRPVIYTLPLLGKYL